MPRWEGWDRLDQGRVEFRRGPKNYHRSDDRISEEIAGRLARAIRIHSSEIELTVRNGRVRLEGSVPERWMKHAIENVTATVWGVEEIENYIRVIRER
jgi:osmotically-inducible protein OsmY